MGQQKDLLGPQAIEKIKDLAKDQICLFCTYQDGEIVSRPMATMGIDDNGAIWFFSKRSSEKNYQVEDDSRVSLMYLDNGKSHYLALNGLANIVEDKQKAAELWSSVSKAWFQDGVDDPELTLIRFDPEAGHYWDTKNGKIVSMLKIAAAVISGKQMDDGISGDLNV